MTDTTTTSTTELPSDVLTLVTLSADAAQSNGMRNHPDERTFFATTTRDSDGAPLRQYVSLLVPTTDPRSVGMHALDDDRYDDLFGGDGGLTRSDYRTWCIPVYNVTRADVVALEREHHERLEGEADRPLAVGDRVRISDDHPAGEPWAGHTGTVQSLGYHLTVETDEGRSGGFRPEFLTRIAPDAPVEAPETAEREQAELFTREALDEAVREAVEAAKREAADALEEFKETANRIAVEYAEENELCGNFERCMEDIGLLGREAWHERHDARYEVTMTVRVTRRGRDEHDARDEAWSDVFHHLPAEYDSTLTVLSVEEVE